MADLTTILSTTIQTVQKLRETTAKLKDAETKNLIADLQLALADIKGEVVQLRDEIAILRDENSLLKHKLEHRDDLQGLLRAEEGYFYEHPDGRYPGPYCSICYEVENRLISLTKLAEDFHSLGTYKCGVCRNLVA